MVLGSECAEEIVQACQSDMFDVSLGGVGQHGLFARVLLGQGIRWVKRDEGGGCWWARRL
jgi:hypothetical protein